MTGAASTSSVDKTRITSRLVGLVSSLLAVAFIVRNLIAFQGDPTVFLMIGVDDVPLRDFVMGLLGSDIHLVSSVGHDGRFFFVQANDPFLLDPSTHAALLDRPVYRSQRMLFPLLVGLGGLLPPWGIVWGMLSISVLAFGLGAYATALISVRMGGSPWWGLAFTLNLGVVSELLVGGSGHLGLALALSSVAALQRGRGRLSIGLLILAVLTREVLLVGALGIALWLWRTGQRRLALAHVFLPALTAGLWALYVRSRAGWTEGTDLHEISWPLQGLVESMELWPQYPMSMVFGVAVILILTLFTYRFVRSNWLVGYLAVGFVPLAVVLTIQVWFDYYNLSRAISPVITAYVLMAFAAKGNPELERIALR